MHGIRRVNPNSSHQPTPHQSKGEQPSTSKRPASTASTHPTKVRKLDNESKPVEYFCSVCKVTIPAQNYFHHLHSNLHKGNCCQPTAMDGVLTIETTFKGRLSTYRLPATEQTVDFEGFLGGIQDKVLQLVRSDVSRHGSVKMNVELFGNYHLKTSGEYSIKSFNTRNEIVTIATDLNHLYQSFVEKMLTKAREFNENKSGMKFVSE